MSICAAWTAAVVGCHQPTSRPDSPTRDAVPDATIQDTGARTDPSESSTGDSRSTRADDTDQDATGGEAQPPTDSHDTATSSTGGPRFSGELIAEEIDSARILGKPQFFLDPYASRSGDANGDGVADVIVDADLGLPAATYVYFGPVGGTLDLDDADVTILCGQCQTVAAGDLNADGQQDYWMGNPGRTYVVEGPILVDTPIENLAASTMVQSDINNHLQSPPYKFDSGRDANGDGILDVLFSDRSAYEHSEEDPNLTGGAWLLHGPLPDGDFRAADLAQSTWIGDWDVHINFGGALLLDLDGDGLADSAIGCGHNTGPITVPGAFHINLSPIAPGFVDMDDPDGVWTGESSYSYFSTTHARAGDIDGDGKEDILAGAYNTKSVDGNDTGAVYVILGPATGDHSGAESFLRMYGVEYDCLGDGVTEAGDVDADGHDDLFVGNLCFSYSGGVHLFYGPVQPGVRTEEEADATIEVSDAYAGTSFAQGLAVPGDVTGDGWNDLVVTASQYGQAGINAGATFLFDPATL